MGFFDDVGHVASNIFRPVNNLSKGVSSGLKKFGSGVGDAFKSVGQGFQTAIKDVGQIGMGIFKTWENFMNKGLNLLSNPVFLIVLAIGGVVILSIAMR